MVHQGKVQRWLLVGLLLLVNVPPLSFGPFPTGFALYFQLFASVLIGLALFVKARVKIRKDNIIYRLQLWTVPLFHQTVYHGEIRRIEFKRSNRKAKTAVIHVEKGIDLRLSLFDDTLFNELAEFAERNKVELQKSKDYRTVEKLGSNRLK